MKKRKLLFTMLALSLGCLSGGSGAMAQNGWENAYAQTGTSSADWTAITEGTTQGKILGAAQSGSSATYYYYVTGSLNFNNNRTDNDGNGNSGLKIHGTVYLYVPAGLTITCEGANADGRTGAGAGIELASGNTLYIIGGGTVKAYGGNAENGRKGGDGTNANGSSGKWTQTGEGGSGGNGGGGAGAGIGTRGGTGGTGGAGGASNYYDGGKEDDAFRGTDGSNGTGGGSAGAMGTLYVANGITVNATGGAAGTSGGAGGSCGRGYVYDGSSYNVTVAAGGGGGGGGFGGAAANIGTGGPGGGGGGGGAGGSQDWRSNSSGGVYVVDAPGGDAGQNANGQWAGDGADAETSASGWHWVDNGSFDSDDWHGKSGDAPSGFQGLGSGKGSNDASAGTQHEGSLTYNVTYTPIKTKLNGTDLTPRVVTYNAGVGSVILPENADGYQWVLRVYGKSCAPSGTSASQFATPTKNYFGGYGTKELERTIVLANVYGNIEFQEIATQCKLNNNGDNTQALAEFILAQYPVTVRLMDRTLYKDGDWNTLCLPFNMTATQIEASPLAGAMIYKMDETTTKYYPTGYDSYNYPVLYFHFINAYNSDPVIQAGKPYLVKWVAKDDYTADGNLVDNTKKGGSRHELDFYNVMVSAATAGNWSGNNIAFQGTLQSSPDLDGGDKTKLVLGKNNMLYYPRQVMNIGACHGYFVIPSSVANLLPDNPSNAPQIMMDFGNGEATGIQTFNVTPESQNDTPVYNLNGQRLSAPKKGINIVNGKKVLVK